jgi:hypothetical protein
MVWTLKRAQMRLSLGHLTLPSLLKIPAGVYYQIAAEGKEPSICTVDGYCIALQPWHGDGKWWYGAYIPRTSKHSSTTSRRLKNIRRFLKLLARRRGDL